LLDVYILTVLLQLALFIFYVITFNKIKRTWEGTQL
jgi:hypothetical protein